ncbi:hypothetical protein WMY93_027756 [Mugilogobius chulae]|uniref:Uncharacterized protein n=1 Tax=Mugilogobius chulae TaxID=88201 RepID=A0AAW0MTW1_9GOBI
MRRWERVSNILGIDKSHNRITQATEIVFGKMIYAERKHVQSLANDTTRVYGGGAAERGSRNTGSFSRVQTPLFSSVLCSVFGTHRVSDRLWAEEVTDFLPHLPSCPTKRPSRRGRPPSKPDPSDLGIAAGLSPLEQQRNMALLEWEGRMRSLSQEQELLAEKRRATRQKESAYRLKKRYYRAKLRRLGEEVPSSSDSELDEGQRLGLTTAHRRIL